MSTFYSLNKAVCAYCSCKSSYYWGYWDIVAYVNLNIGYVFDVEYVVFLSTQTMFFSDFTAVYLQHCRKQTRNLLLSHLLV